MIFAVNRWLPESEKIPHRLFWGRWTHVRDEYNRLHPKGFIYQLTLVCAATVIVIALLFAFLRVWEYTHGQLP
jgi:hypothetical protein